MNSYYINFFVSLLSTFGVTYLYYKLTDANKKINLKIIIVFFIGVVFLSIIRFFDITFISVISYFLYFPFLFLLLNYDSFAKYLFYLIIVWIYGVFLDMASMVIALFLQVLFNFNIYSYTSRILLTSLVFILFLVLGNSKKIKSINNNLFKKVQKINYFDFALVSFALFVFFIGLVIFLSLNNLELSVMLMVILVLLSFSFILLIRVRIHLVENDIFLKLLQENNDFYIKIEDENRIFKHNLMAKLLSIKSVSSKKARDLIDDFINSFNQNMDFSIQIKNIPYGFNGIIYEKIYPYIGKLYIKIDNKIDFNIFDRLKPRRYNVFVEKMIVSLDNAIESSLLSNEKLLIINLYSEENNIIMDIKNTFSAMINLDELGNINYSTKNNNSSRRRGLGLFSVMRNNEVSISIKITNNLFITKIIAKQNVDFYE